LTEKQDKFISEYVITGNAKQSAITAGYSPKTANAQGFQLKNKLRSQIEDATYKVLQDKIPLALNWVTTLAQNAESESVRLSAIKDILDRAGLKPVERVETTTIESMSDDEIQRELDALRTRH
jgi:phage terminase small subunit